MAYLETINLPDAVVLYNDTVMAPTVGPTLDTTGFGNIVVQVDCETQIQAIMEGTNDQVDWFPIFVNPLNDLNVTDAILAEGGYQFKTTFKYIRFNVSYCGGGDGCKFIIIGRAGQGDNASDMLAAAFNPDTPLRVAFGSSVKQDNNGALILSDGIPYLLEGSNTFLINLDGYSTIIIQSSSTQTITPTQSIDGTYWNATLFGLHNGTTISATPNAAGIWIAPVLGKYLRIVLSGAVAGPTLVSVMLKQAPMNGTYYNSGQAPTNLAQIAGAAVSATTAQLGLNVVNYGGTAVVTGGVAGMPAVGGNIAPGSAPTANPVPVGGVDTGGLTRRLLTDITGRALIAGSQYLTNVGKSPTANASYPMNTLGVLPSSYQQSAALNVQDTSQYEGQNTQELLALILLELRILNQQIYELPKTLATSNYSDPPEALRQEQSIFNI